MRSGIRKGLNKPKKRNRNIQTMTNKKKPWAKRVKSIKTFFLPKNEPVQDTTSCMLTSKAIKVENFLLEIS